MQVTTQAPAAQPGPIRRMVQRNMYRWHRIIGIITVIPVIFWTLSGLAHPLMSNWLRPKIAREFLVPVPAPRLTVPLQQVLRQNNVPSLRNVRLVRWQGQPTYQVLLEAPTAVPRYFSATTGLALPASADQQYAEQLARYFAQDTTAKVASAERLTAFDGEYKFVNRLLPVWKITLDRPDGLTVYVETMPARMATFNNRARTTFIRVFDLLHNWSFLELVGGNTFRVVTMLGLLTIILASTVSGLVIYGFMWKRFRKPRSAQDQVGWLRKYHRQVGLAVAFVTFTFAGSGAFHVYLKLHPDDRLRYQHAPAIRLGQLQVDLTALPLQWKKVQNVALAEFEGQVYYQVFQLPPNEEAPNSSTAGGSTGQPIEAVKAVAYYSAATGQLLPDGATRHARALANTFLQEASGTATLPGIEKTELIDHFEGEYGFINKRLPVVKVAYCTPTKTTLYVEPATNRLAARVENADRYEGLSFAFLHKFHFIGTVAGKDVRDMVTMLSALGVLAVSLLGLWLFVKVK
ncbi:PepSY domain-containing protein [Hymenobacter wooponensis]|uniref:PepSY domain-containing protein n=1 Tax=Hymenobacter wooponensis TaxID=1525360 RepID=A0A4Z0MHI9_9BACT|nr:PepSY domain-containing protein [Hymenobacter wooponensis]TGD78748.1 PepSY domain-containing protein [Hymenobacter wooponensis]